MVQGSPVLAQLYLSRVGGEEQHDGEARQQASVLDGKGEEEAASTCVLFLTTHLIHLWKLRSIQLLLFVFTVRHKTLHVNKVSF